MWQCPFFHSQWILRYYCILNEIILLSPGKCSWGPEQSAVKAMVSSLKGCAVHKGTACAMKEMEALLLEASCSEFLLSSFEGSQVLAQGWLLPKGVVVISCWEEQQLQKGGN